jgi:hypothetical protein
MEPLSTLLVAFFFLPGQQLALLQLLLPLHVGHGQHKGPDGFYCC